MKKQLKDISNGFALFYGDPSESQVLRIYKSYKAALKSYKKLVYMFGVGKFYIQMIQWRN